MNINNFFPWAVRRYLKKIARVPDMWNTLIQLKENFNEHDLSPIRDLTFEKKHNPFFRIDQYSFLDLIKNKNLFENEEIQFRFKLLRRFRDEW